MEDAKKEHWEEY
jgi:hypothetical protein